MKILIVEDEKRAREGLKNLISENFREIEVLEPAENGREGLRRIEKEAPDIVITDIRMPDLSGLDMLALIPGGKPRPYLLVVTGFSDFEYARKSLDLGVNGYILKPFTAEDILGAVNEGIHGIRSSYSMNRLMNESVETGNQSPCCQFLFSYPPEIGHESAFKGIRKAILSTLGGSSKLDQYSEDPIRILSFNLTGDGVARIDDEKVANLQRRLGQIFKSTVVGVLSTEAVGSQRVNRLRSGLALHKFYSLSPLLNLDNIEWDETPDPHMYWNLEKNLLWNLRKENYAQALRDLENWFIDLAARFYRPEELEVLVQKISLALMSSLKEQNRQGFQEAIRCCLPSRIQECRHKEELTELFRQIVDLHRNRQHIPHSQNPLIFRVLQRIHSNTEEAMTLEDMADFLHISPEHLSRLFKEDTGTGFNSYVNQLKINIARERLVKDGYSINDVAESLGYSSARYFARVFKKITGMTPREYRDLAKG